MTKPVKYLRKILALLIGVPLTVVGLIMIPVPGPGGIPLTMAGLFILSLEFDWAKPYLEKLKAYFKKAIDEAKVRPKP